MEAGYNPPDEDCLEGAKLAIENARLLATSAEDTAQAGRYGPACSLLVLAGEEAFKAFALQSKHQGLEITDEAQELGAKMMTDHRTRHQVARVAAVMDRLAQAVMEGIEEYISFLEGDKETAKDKKMRIIKRRLLRLLDDQAEETKNLESETDWWDRADDLKKKGFYVDYGPDGWTSPSKLERDDYERSKQIVEKTIEKTSEALSAFEDLEGQHRKDFLRAMRETIQVASDKSWN